MQIAQRGGLQAQGTGRLGQGIHWTMAELCLTDAPWNPGILEESILLGRRCSGKQALGLCSDPPQGWLHVSSGVSLAGFEGVGSPKGDKGFRKHNCGATFGDSHSESGSNPVGLCSCSVRTLKSLWSPAGLDAIFLMA